MDGNPAFLVTQLLDEIRLDAGEVARRLEQATDPLYWSSLIPWLSVCGVASNRVHERAPIADRSLFDTVQRLEENGYFEMPPVFAAGDVERMRDGIEAL